MTKNKKDAKLFVELLAEAIGNNIKELLFDVFADAMVDVEEVPVEKPKKKTKKAKKAKK